MNTYYFKINAVDTYVSKTVNDTELQDVVYNVHWSYFGEHESGKKIDSVGMTEVSDPDPSNYTNFDDLTEEMVISWIEPMLDVTKMQEWIDGKLAELVSPTKQTRFLNGMNPAQPESEVEDTPQQ